MSILLHIEFFYLYLTFHFDKSQIRVKNLHTRQSSRTRNAKMYRESGARIRNKRVRGQRRERERKWTVVCDENRGSADESG